MGRLVYSAMAIALTVCGVNPPAANAAPLSTSELRNLYFENAFFVQNDGSGNCIPPTVLSGSETAEKVFNYFISKGLTPPQVAGIMGNLQAESGMNPRRVQDKQGQPRSPDSDVMKLDGKTGYGLAQWTFPARQNALHAAAVAAGTQDSDLLVQLEYLWSELNGEFKSTVLEPLLSTSDYRQASNIFLLEFENPKNEGPKVQNERASLSLGFLTQYGSLSAAANQGTPSDDTGATVVLSTCAGSGDNNTVIAGYSLPVTDKIYEDKKAYFAADHHLKKDGSPSPGADIPLPTNTLIYSMSDGVIKKAPNGSVGRSGGYGLGVTVDAGNGVTFIYGHGTDGGSYPGAKEGDRVKAGQPIMHSGNTGSSTGPHLHISIVIDGQQRCPQTFFAGIANKKIPDVKSLPASGCSSGDRL